MNYYERHLGDYAKDTAHLSMLEHGAYTLLMDRYYTTETGIPKDQAYRVTRAQSKTERAAVDAVLKEFFTLNDGVWVKGRCEEVIQTYRDGIPAAQERREHDKERQQRARERRQTLFNELESHGVVMPWNTPVTALRDELSRVTGRNSHAPVTSDNTASSPIPIPNHKSKSPDPASPAPVLDPRKALFDLGVSMMGEKKRSLIGKAISEIGEAKVAEIIGAMAAKPPVDPGAYFAAATQPKVRGVQC